MSAASPAAGGSAISLEQFVALNDEIASLVRAGVPLELGLKSLGGESGGALGRISTVIAGRMQHGASLDEAIAAEGERLPVVYRTVILAGIRAGKLSSALEALSNFGRELLELRRQIGMALLYPVVVLLLAYGLFVVFLVDFVERVRETYLVFRFPIHRSLAVLIWVAETTAAWWWVPPLLFCGAFVWWNRTGGAHLLSSSGGMRGLWWFPGVGWIGRTLQRANFTELLALLLEHQIPFPESLRLAADATGDKRLRSGAERLAEIVERGDDVTDDPSWMSWFPPFLCWILVQTARGARPVKLLRQTAGIYRRRASNLARWIKVFLPAAAALLIGGLATMFYSATIFLPLTNLWRDLVME